MFESLWPGIHNLVCVYRNCAKWRLLVCAMCSVVSDSLWPHGLYPTRLLYPWGFSRQEHWSGLPCLPPGDLPNPGIEPSTPTSPALAGGFFTTSAIWEAPISSSRFQIIGQNPYLVCHSHKVECFILSSCLWSAGVNKDYVQIEFYS